MSLHPVNGIAGRPKHNTAPLAARNPWDAQVPLNRRDQRMKLSRIRWLNPLPPPSPYWQRVKF